MSSSISITIITTIFIISTIVEILVGGVGVGGGVWGEGGGWGVGGQGGAGGTGRRNRRCLVVCIGQSLTLASPRVVLCSPVACFNGSPPET